MLALLIPLYLFLLPIQWALSPIAGIDLALSRVFAAGLIALWLARSLARKQLFLPRPAILLPLVSYLMLVTASILWSEDRSWALRKTVFLWNFLPLVAVFSAAFRDRALRDAAIRAIIGSGAVAGMIGILQSASQFIFGIERAFAFWTGTLLPFFLGGSLGTSVANYPSLLVNIGGATILRASAFFPDPHMLSLFLGLTLPIALAYALGLPASRRRWPSIAALIIALTDLLTFSRGGYLGLIGGALAAGMLMLSGHVSKHMLRSFITGGAAVFIIAIALILTPVGSRFLSSFSLDDGSNSERLRLWQEAAGHIAEHPFLGTGIGNYPLAVKPTADYREPIYVHDLFLDITVETGLISLACFLAALAAATCTAYSVWRKQRLLLAGGSLVSLAIFLSHSLFELPLFSVQVLPLFLAILALASVTENESSDL